jgi:putative CocE/NonD family hydrolase
VENVVVRGPGKVSIQAVVVRPKTLDPIPALFEFTIYDSQSYAKESAAHGYAGVVAYVRGVRGSEDPVTPFEHDGGDARAVIEWIAKQPWSNGDVAMYGSGYSGFAAWAATSRVPEPLKAIALSDPAAPGVTVPMMGGIFHSSAYRWAYQLNSAKAGSDDKRFEDGQWRAFMREWYTQGKSYREFVAAGSGPHSELFGRWLSHPSYDRSWQRLVPSTQQLAKMNIPVLTMTGYYADAQAGALYYFAEHYEHNPKANHTLLVGPFDDGAVLRAPPSVVKGYAVDASAQIELRELRYEWFDHILKKAEKPGLLRDRVNYQLMGSNEWRHVPSLDAMHSGSMKLYLEEIQSAETNRLASEQNKKLAFLPQTFDLADRSDVDQLPHIAILSRRLTVQNAEVFVSEPLQQPVDVSGALTGELDFRVNKMDMDVSVSLYELLPSGEYLRLYEPACDFRASYARDRTRRRLLKAGVRQQLPFQCERLMGRRVQAGSRVVLVLGINKRPDQQINYGTGGDVSTETIEDARVPLRIRWYNTSYIEVPIQR